MKFCLTDHISYDGMELTSDRKARREHTWQETSHFQEDEPIYNAVLFCLQVLNPVMEQKLRNCMIGINSFENVFTHTPTTAASREIIPIE